MIRRELAKDPKLATESWDRFLPKFRKRHLKTSEKTAKKNEKLEAKNEARTAAGLPVAGPSKPAKKVYTPFPPSQLPRKVLFFSLELVYHRLRYVDRPATGIRRVLPQSARKRGTRGRAAQTKGIFVTRTLQCRTTNQGTLSNPRRLPNGKPSVQRPSSPLQKRLRQLWNKNGIRSAKLPRLR